MQGFFGERLASYTTQIKPDQIITLLGHDPRSKNWRRLPDEVRKIYEFLQRKTSKTRRDGISGYIEERLGPDAIAIGAFPSISIALQNPALFKSYQHPSIQKAVGDLMVDISPMNPRVLIDGLGRITGALDLIEEGQKGLLEKFMFPVTIYAPLPDGKPMSWSEMGQLFHDFNFRVQPVSRQHALHLDQSDLYISLARKLGAQPFISDFGGVAERAASLGSKSTELVVQTVLVRTFRGACEGRKFQESNLSTAEDPHLNRETFSALLNSMADFFSSIAHFMGKDRFTDRSSMLLSSSGWQALGIIHHDVTFKLKLSPLERTVVTEKIAGIDWSRFNPDWLTLGIGHPEIDKKTGEQVKDQHGRLKVALTGAGRTTTQHLINYIREKADLANLLKDDEVTPAAFEKLATLPKVPENMPNPLSH